MTDIKTCKSCGELFAAVADREICQKCYRNEEKDFETVYQFLKRRKNREATIDEIVEATGVKEDLIIKFMRQNRLRSSQFPNLAYGCEKCSSPISEGRLCDACSEDIKSQYRQHEAMEQRMKEDREKSEPIYFTMKKKK